MTDIVQRDALSVDEVAMACAQGLVWLSASGWLPPSVCVGDAVVSACGWLANGLQEGAVTAIQSKRAIEGSD